MKKFKLITRIVVLIFAIVTLASCTKDIDIAVPEDDEKVVIEAYVSNLAPNLNYVLITKTVNYFKPDFSLKGFGNAMVKVNEGKINSPGDTTWKTITLNPNILLQGYYNNDSLVGKIGYAYKLEIWLNGEYYKGFTTMPQVVPIDSITRDILFNGTTPRALMTVHFQEPAPAGQNYRLMFRYASTPTFFAWGDIADSNQTYFNDDNANGIYRHVTYRRTFQIGDTIQYYIGTMDRPTYNFWNSFEKARRNGGPFATPVQLLSNVQGKNVIGSFSGYAVDQKQFIFKN